MAFVLLVLGLCAPLKAQGLRVGGTVVDAQGHGVSDVVVRLLPYPDDYSLGVAHYKGQGLEAAAAVRTSEGGRFELKAPHPGLWLLTARAGERGAMRGMALVAERELGPLELPSTRRVTVEVQDEEARAVPSALVLVYAQPHVAGSGSSLPPRLLWAGRSDESGRVELGVPFASEFAVRGTADSFVPGGAASGIGSTRRLVLSRGRRLEVEVRNLGRPQPGALIRVGSPPVPVALTDEAGRAVLWRQRHGKTPVEALFHGGASARRELEAEDSSAPVVLELEPPRRLRGRVVSSKEETPIAGALVWSPDDGSLVARSTADGLRPSAADGGYVLALPRAGPRPPLALAAAGGGHVSATGRLTPAHLERGEAPTLLLDPARRVRGVVVDESQRPVLDAEIRLVPLPAGSPNEAVVAWSHEEGRFELSYPADGDFYLVARAQGFATVRSPALEMAPGRQVLELGQVVLAEAVTLEGRVKDGEGTPLGGAAVRIAGGATTRITSSGAEPAAWSAEDGHFEIPELPRGQTLELEVRLAGFSTAVLRGVRAPGHEPVEVVLTPSVSLRGIVVEEGNDPVPGAEVFLHAEQGSVPDSARGVLAAFRTGGPTDREGRFLVTDLAAGQWTIQAWARGFQESERQALSLAPGEETEELRVVLEPGATVAGRVLGPGGEPVSGAQVRTSAPERDSLARVMAGKRAFLSDEGGSYRLEGLALGPTSFLVRHPEYQPLTRDLDVVPGDNDLDFVLKRGWEISGRTVDAAGSPVAGAWVRAHSPQDRLDGGRQGVASAADGSFTLGGLSDGSYTVTAEEPGYATARSEEAVRIEGRSVHGVELELHRGAAVVGRLLGLGLHELAAVRVMAVQAEGPVNVKRAQVYTGGSYRIEDLGIGEWRVTASVGNDAKVARRTVVVEPGVDHLSVDLDFHRGWTLSGQVLRDEDARGGLRIVAMEVESGTVTMGVTDHDGRFALQGLESGTFQLQVTVPGGRTIGRRTVELRGDLEVVVQVFELAVRGRVSDEADQSPIAGAELALLPRHRASGFNFGYGTSPRSAADGTFELAGIPPGDYRLTVKKEGYAMGAVDLTLEDGDVLGVEVSLSPAQGLTLYVLLPSGRPAQDVALAVLDRNGQALAAGVYPTAEGGRLHLPELPTGTWTLLASGGGSSTRSLEVSVPGEPLTLRLPDSGGLTVRAPALEGSGRTVELRLSDPGGRPYRSVEALIGLAPPHQGWYLVDGKLTIPLLPEGTWIVEVGREAQVQGGTAQVTVLPGRRVHLTLD